MSDVSAPDLSDNDLDYIWSVLSNKRPHEGDRSASLVEIEAHVNSRRVKAMIDSGASQSCVSETFAVGADVKIEPLAHPREALLPNGQRIKIMGRATLPIRIGSYLEDVDVVVLNLSNFDLILGLSWLRQADALSEWRTGNQTVRDRHGVAHHLGPTPTRLLALAPDATVGDFELMSYRQMRRAIKKKKELYFGWIRTSTESESSPDHTAASLAPTGEDALNSVQHLAADTASGPTTSKVSAPTADPASTPTVNKSSADTASAPTSNEASGPTADVSFRKVMASGNEAMDDLVASFADVFQDNIPETDISSTVGPLRKLDRPIIDTSDSAPINRRAYNLTPTQLEEQKKQVHNLLTRGLIRESSSPWGFPVLFVPKKDGGWRMCVDYRALNAVTKRNGYPLPLIQQCLDVLGKACRFSKIDLTSGYWQIHLFESDVPKTAFNTRHGKFEFLVMPFGLTNAPAVFQTLVNNALRKHIDVFVIVYLDDILIYSADEKQHLEHVRTVLEILRTHRLYAKPSKCFFNREEIEFCGHMVGQGTVRPMSDKLQVIEEWPRPRSVHDVRSFLGLASYYRRFAKAFASVAAPLFELLKKGDPSDKKSKSAPIVWNFGCQRAFERVKEILCSAPALRQPDTTKAFTIETDASDWAIGCVLSQTNESGQLQPVAYDGRKMNDAEKKYPVHEKELLAIRHALRIWRHYVDNGMKITILTDHESLKYIPTTKIASKRLARWVSEFGEYDLELRYRKGSENIVADSISRRPDFLMSLSDVPDEVADMADYLQGKPIADGRRPTLAKYASKYRVGPDGDLLRLLEDGTAAPYLEPPHRLMFMEKMHSEYGHMGAVGLSSIVRQRAWWPGMTHDFTKFCRSCPTCQVCQRPRPGQEREYAVLMAEAKVEPFERWGIDLIGILPETPDGNKWLVTAVDYCTGWPLARALPDAKAWRIAEFIYDDIFMNFGCPREVISDNGENFLANAVEHLFSEMKTKHRLATAYHPRTNGKVENLNGTVGRMLTKLVVGLPTRLWDRYLSRALFACRVRTHNTTGFSPFRLVYGIDPTLPTDEPQPRALDAPTADPTRRLDDLRTDRARARDRTLQRAQKAKAAHDALVTPHKLSVGSYVLVRHENPLKFEAKWFGPYRVAHLQTLGTYALETLAGQPLRALVHGNRLMAARLPGTERTVRRMWNDPAQRSNLRNILGVDWADASAAASADIARAINIEYETPARPPGRPPSGQAPQDRTPASRSPTERAAPTGASDTASRSSLPVGLPSGPTSTDPQAQSALIPGPDGPSSSQSPDADPSVPATVEAPRRRIKVVWKGRDAAASNR